jgi:hypothetical protein
LYESGAYSLSPVAKYVPSPIIMNPVAVLCLRRNTSEDRSFFPSGPANRITIRSAEVFRNHRNRSQHDELEKHMPRPTVDELRDERKKEQRGLGIEDFRRRALPEWISCCQVGRRREITRECLL